MSDFYSWLRRNKLEQYFNAFTANDVDLDILPGPTEHDFAELGASLGNRQRLIEAIAEPSPSFPGSQTARSRVRRGLFTNCPDILRLADQATLAPEAAFPVVRGIFRRMKAGASASCGTRPAASNRRVRGSRPRPCTCQTGSPGADGPAWPRAG
jgi:hypothetical protein